MGSRSPIEPVKSEFRIVGAILTWFVAMSLFTVGYNDIIKPENQKVGLGWAPLLVAIITRLHGSVLV